MITFMCTAFNFRSDFARSKQTAGFLSSCLMQLVSNNKVNSSKPLSLQLVCNQGNHPSFITTNQFYRVTAACSVIQIIKIMAVR